MPSVDETLLVIVLPMTFFYLACLVYKITDVDGWYVCYIKKTQGNTGLKGQQVKLIFTYANHLDCTMLPHHTEIKREPMGWFWMFQMAGYLTRDLSYCATKRLKFGQKFQLENRLWASWGKEGVIWRGSIVIIDFDGLRVHIMDFAKPNKPKCCCLMSKRMSVMRNCS